MMSHYQKRERSNRTWRVAMNRCGVMHSRNVRTRNQADELRIPCNQCVALASLPGHGDLGGNEVMCTMHQVQYMFKSCGRSL